LFFVGLFLTQIVRQARQAVKYRNVDSLRSELHTFLWMNLVCVALHIYIGIDLNAPELWLYIGLCVLLQKLKPSVSAKEASSVHSVPRPTSPQPPSFALA
jgi:hypothetical protein